MVHRAPMIPNRRQAGVRIMVRAQVAALLRYLVTTAHDLTQLVAWSLEAVVGGDRQGTAAQRLVPVPVVDSLDRHVRPGCAGHGADIDLWQSAAGLQISPPSLNRPPSRPSGPGGVREGPSIEGPAVDEDEIEVVVEIPRGSGNKYAFGNKRHIIRLGRRLFSGSAYPADYGCIPETLPRDGDQFDALVLAEAPIFPGCHVMARPGAVFWRADEKGPDVKIVCVPSREPRWHDVSDRDHLPEGLSDEIRLFFDIYKDPEPGKETSANGYDGREVALAEVKASHGGGSPTDDAEGQP
jgi:inorganic pyrophosphatase